MKSTILLSLRGYVLLEIRGRRLERLVNRLVEKRISVWDIRFRAEDRAEMYMPLSDFFRLRPLLKETGCRMHVLKRVGFPFILTKLEQRKLFVLGVIGFVIGLYVLSSVVWQVRVVGNESISTDDILQAARQEGVYTLQWKFRLQNSDTLSKKLLSKLPNAAWVGVEVQGTHVVIKVVEAVLPEQQPLLSPRHLISSKNAMITSIFTEKGRPLVKPNTYVRKGDILISGILGDELNEQTVVAKGEVKGLVWYTPKVEVPLVRKYNVYTGEVKKRSYLVLGGRGLQLTGYGKLPFTHYETIPERKTLQWKDYVLPIGWLNERVMEVGTMEQPVELAEARMHGLERAKSEILQAAGDNARVVSEKILHEKTENGTVYMEVLLEVEESLALEQPIVPTIPTPAPTP
ncbi:sporulation protein YqfD [Paenibacillus xerothermodurans]|uniref:Sporulation protein YqfD n=1 Tax=Paenibacillus xerothermodurans TaxID=1977292 RepID=A0A2W1P6L5_PAEXE|nr:sporulation protein YqfD [Paenibacillus xerothermodurans]PZE22698.1 sporulation protein YqfD [Paenibacillus xerothermodurans]